MRPGNTKHLKTICWNNHPVSFRKNTVVSWSRARCGSFLRPGFGYQTSHPGSCVWTAVPGHVEAEQTELLRAVFVQRNVDTHGAELSKGCWGGGQRAETDQISSTAGDNPLPPGRDKRKGAGLKENGCGVQANPHHPPGQQKELPPKWEKQRRKHTFPVIRRSCLG